MVKLYLFSFSLFCFSLSVTQFSRWVIDVDLEMCLLRGHWKECGALCCFGENSFFEFWEM